ncbi:MAG TPA: hypothetical protein VER11_25985 [Polyangiaceae bacterium]|nr:hypothetical protein [Polyangiaceae bacterium]
MSATLPPAANFDRPSDFGEFWQHAEVAPRPESVLPQPEPETPVLPLTPEQQARRQRFRRAVGGIVLGLLAFTALAGSVHVVRAWTTARSDSEVTKPVAATSNEPQQAHVSAALPAPQAVEAPAPTEAERALTLARTPASAENLETWTRIASQLSASDRKLVEHDLSRLTVTGARAAQETARLQLALLWRATARRAKAQKVLVSLARTATDPVVKKYARGALTAA